MLLLGCSLRFLGSYCRQIVTGDVPFLLGDREKCRCPSAADALAYAPHALPPPQGHPVAGHHGDVQDAVDGHPCHVTGIQMGI